MTKRFDRLARTVSCGALAMAASPLLAQSATYTRPNLTTAAGMQTVQLGGITFANQGLVGVGRLAAATGGHLAEPAHDHARRRLLPDRQHGRELYRQGSRLERDHAQRHSLPEPRVGGGLGPDQP